MAEPYDDDPLVRQLREPGTPGELADQDHYLAMFRETRGAGKVTPLTSAPSRRGRAARFGAGTTLSIALAVAGGGVAAAYTANLPDPIQEFAHTVLGPVNVPPPTQRKPDRVEAAPSPEATPSGEQSPSPSATPDAQPTPTGDPSKPAGDGKPSDQASLTNEPSESASESPTGSPTASPTETPTATPSTTPTPTPTSTPTSTPTPTSSPTTGIEPPLAASLSITSSTHRVGYADSPTFTGTVRSEDDIVVPDVQVALMQLVDDRWKRVAFATSDDEGLVSMSAPPVLANTSMRFVTKGARSTRWRVSVQPDLALSTTVNGDTVTLAASTVGGQQGDVVRLSGRRNGVMVTLATGILGPDGTVTFQVQQPTKKSRYAAVLEATSDHLADKTVVVVVKQKPEVETGGTQSP